MADREVQIKITADVSPAEGEYKKLTGEIEAKPLKLEIDADVSAAKKSIEDIQKMLKSVMREGKDKQMKLSVEGIDELLSKFDDLKTSIKDITSALGMKDLKSPEFYKAQIDGINKQIDAYKNARKEYEQIAYGSARQSERNFGDILKNMTRSGTNQRNIIDSVFGDQKQIQATDTIVKNLAGNIRNFVNMGGDVDTSLGKNLGTVRDLIEEINKSTAKVTSGKTLSSFFEDISLDTKSITQLQKERTELQTLMAESEARMGTTVKAKATFDEASLKKLAETFTSVSGIAEKLGDVSLSITDEDVSRITESFEGLKDVLQQIHDLLSSFDIPKVDKIVNATNSKGEEKQKEESTTRTIRREDKQTGTITTTTQTSASSVTSGDKLQPPEEKTITIKADSANATEVINSIKSALDELPSEKTIKINVVNYDKIPLLSDAAGNIKEVYRGLNDTFGSTGMGGFSWFTDRLETAVGYVDTLAADGKVIKANLAFQNPLEIFGKGARFDAIDVSGLSKAFTDEAQKMGFDLSKMLTDNIVEVAKSIGHDGVIFRNILDGFDNVAHDVYTTISPYQVKNEELYGTVLKGTGELIRNIDTSSVENLANANREAAESANQLADAQQRVSDATNAAGESSVSSKANEYEQLAEAANQAKEAEANATKPGDMTGTPADVSAMVEQMTQLAEQLNAQTQALQQQSESVQNIISTERQSFSELATTITEITEKYSQFSQEMAKITETENTANTYKASPVENVEQLTTAYQSLSKAIVEAQEAQNKLTSLSTEKVDVDGLTSTVSYASQFSELGTVITDITRDINGLSSFISQVNDAATGTGINDYSQVVGSLSTSLAELKQEDIEKINDLSAKLSTLADISPESIGGVLGQLKVDASAAENVESLATAFEHLKTAISGFGGDANFAGTMQPLTELLSHSNELQNLANIFKESESKIEAVSKAVSPTKTGREEVQIAEYEKLTEAVNKYVEAKKVLDSGAGTVTDKQVADYKQAMDAQAEYISKMGLYSEKMQEKAMKPISTQNLKDIQSAETTLSKVYSYIDENKNISGFDSQFQNLKQQADSLKETVVSIKENISDVSTDNIKQLSSDLTKTLSQTKTNVSSELKARATENAKALKDSGIKNVLAEAKEISSQNADTAFQPMKEQLEGLNSEIEKTESLLSSLNLKDLSSGDVSQITQQTEALKEAMSSTSQAMPVSAETRTEGLSNITSWMENNVILAEQYKTELESIKQAMSDAQTVGEFAAANEDFSWIKHEIEGEQKGQLGEQAQAYQELYDSAKAYADIMEKIITHKAKPGSISPDEVNDLREAYEKLADQLEKNETLYDKQKYETATKPVQELENIRQQQERIDQLAEAKKQLREADKYVEQNADKYTNSDKVVTSINDVKKKLAELREEYEKVSNADVGADASKIGGLMDNLSQAMSNAKSNIKEFTDASKNKFNSTGIESILKRAEIASQKNAGTTFEPMQKQVAALNAKIEETRELLSGVDKTNLSGKQFEDLKTKAAELNEQLNKMNDPSLQPANELKKSNALSSFDTWAANNSVTAEKYANQIDLLREKLKSADSEFKLDNSIAEVNRFKASVTEAGDIGATFGSKMMKTFSNLSRYLMTYVSFYRIVGVFKEAISTAKELDTALKDIRMVSSDSLKSIQDYQRQSFDMADKIGSNALDLQKSTAQWIRLGYDFKEASEASTASSWLTNVSEFDSIENATTALVSMKAAYDDLSFEDILDKLNGIGDSFSSSTDQLASGLQNAAAVLQLQGNSMDQALALLTAGNDITQDMSKTSAGIRTISLRIAGTKEAKQEIAD